MIFKMYGVGHFLFIFSYFSDYTLCELWMWCDDLSLYANFCKEVAVIVFKSVINSIKVLYILLIEIIRFGQM